MREAISSNGAPKAVGFYSQAVKAGDLLFLSGQVCCNPQTGELEKDSIESQTRRIMLNIKAIVEEAGSSMDNVIHCRVALSDMKHFAAFNAVYGEFFSPPYPARMTTSRAGIYADLDVEIDAIVSLR